MKKNYLKSQKSSQQVDTAAYFIGDKHVNLSFFSRLHCDIANVILKENVTELNSDEVYIESSTP